jgi:hypothetical protein
MINQSDYFNKNIFLNNKLQEHTLFLFDFVKIFLNFIIENNKIFYFYTF